MRIILQRVSEASVKVDNETVGAIGPGALVLFGVHKEDQASQVAPFVDKVIHLRCFRDENDKMNLSLLDVGGELLVVSQFTLYANCKSGRRPSFTDSAPGEHAKVLYELFAAEAKAKLPKVETGSFGAYMQVSLVNDGPVTLIVEVPRCGWGWMGGLSRFPG